MTKRTQRAPRPHHPRHANNRLQQFLGRPEPQSSWLKLLILTLQDAVLAHMVLRRRDLSLGAGCPQHGGRRRLPELAWLLLRRDSHSPYTQLEVPAATSEEAGRRSGCSRGCRAELRSRYGSPREGHGVGRKWRKSRRKVGEVRKRTGRRASFSQAKEQLAG